MIDPRRKTVAVHCHRCDALRIGEGRTECRCDEGAWATALARRKAASMIDDQPESAAALRSTGVGLAGAAILFVTFLLYCKMHSLWGESVPLSVSARWAASATLCWSTFLLVGWANRHRLRTIAAGPLPHQARLFLLGLTAASVTDMVSMQLAGMMSNEHGPIAEIVARLFGFAPRAAMLSAIAMLSLILWNRRAPAAPRPAVATHGEWLDFPEAPLLRLRAEEVRLIRSAGNYSEIVGAGRTWLVRAPIGDLAARLLPRGFVRIHRRIVINVRHVRSVSRDARGRPTIMLSDGDIVTVGRSYRDELDRLTGA
jgi:hypothetical protein